MGLFQDFADWIKGWQTPVWLRKILKYLLDFVILPTLKGIGQEVYSDLQRLIVTASKNNKWDNRKKFDYVFDEFKSKWGKMKNIKDHTINFLIELCFSELKRKKII
jgi:hypothetical protein